jgi:hypothetical protein
MEDTDRKERVPGGGELAIHSKKKERKGWKRFN